MTFTPRPGRTDLPPPRKSHLPRARLDALWTESANRRLILVTAGAGCGKTSFVTERARAEKRRVIWFTLSEEDAEPAAFLAMIADGILAGDPHGLAEAAENLDTAKRLLDRLLRPLAAPGESILIVLDDAQVLARSEPILRMLEFCAQALPEGSSLLIATREPLDLRIARLRSMSEVATITARDLRFDETETTALFQMRFPGKPIEPALCCQIVTRMEGWAAGIAMLLQATEDPSPETILRAIEAPAGAGTGAGAGSGWFSYFAEEVIGREDPALQAFLLRASLLPRLEPALCDRVLGTNRSADLLENLAERNLFTFRISEKPPVYRFHNLFQEFLLGQLPRRVEAREIDRLRRNAARALGESGEWVDAACVYADLRDSNAVLKLIETHGGELLATGRYHAIRRALSSLPRATLSRRPLALAVLGHMQEIQGQWTDAAATYRLALRQQPAGALRAELDVLLAQVHMRQSRYAAAARLCREALEVAARRSPKVTADAYCLLGLIAAECGRLDEAEEQFGRANLAARKAKNPSCEARALSLQAVNLHAFRGEFREAKDAARKALLIYQGQGDQRRISHTMGMLGYLSMCTADEREARDLTEGALRMAEALGYRMIEGYCHHTLGKCALLASEPEHARGHFEHARAIGDELHEPALMALPRIGLAEAALAEGNRHAAKTIATEVARLARSRKDRFQEALCMAILGLAHAGGDRNRDGIKRRDLAWSSAQRTFRKMGARCEFNRLLLLQLDSGALPEKQRTTRLREFLESVAELGHEFLLLSLEPGRAARVLPMALELDIESRYVTQLLVRMGPTCVEPVRRLLSSSQESVRERAIEVLVRIGGEDARAALSRVADTTSPSGRAAHKAVEELSLVPCAPLRILALGAMEVAIGDRLIDQNAWRSTRARRLFQLLLVHRFRWIPKEEVVETLWPDSDPDKSEISLRQSVLLLRKTLEPALEETRLSRYVRFHGNAYRLDPGEGHSYDVETFEECLRVSSRPDGKARSSHDGSNLQKAIALYRGPFMSETPYEEFLAAERERIADALLRAIDRLLDSTAESGHWEAAIPLSRRGLQIDPFRESFHFHLVQACLALGHRREALAGYHAYEGTMKRELGLPPSPAMRRLAERVTALAG
jgi:LuxR family transcriptional regulator, maltose regulon positive regulatory protein